MGKNGSNTGQIVTSWSLEKKNVDLDDVGDFLGTELKPLQFQKGFFFFSLNALGNIQECFQISWEPRNGWRL